MRSLALELKRKGLRLAVGGARELYRVYGLLRELGLSGSVVLCEDGIKVPVRALASRHPKATFACWLASQLVGSSSLTLGVDFGEKNIGVAAVVEGVVAYTGVLRSVAEVRALAADLLELGFSLRVRLGYTGQNPFNAERVATELQREGLQVELVSEDEARVGVLLGDFSFVGKLSQHEVSALKIALSAAALSASSGERYS